jgi:hypothetical protein
MATARLEPSELQQECYVCDVIHMMVEWMSIWVVELDVNENDIACMVSTCTGDLNGGLAWGSPVRAQALAHYSAFQSHIL